jgi:RNA-directed DNA polymerase
MLGPTHHQFERGLTSVTAERDYKELLRGRFRAMQANRVPVVFSLMHLAVLCGVRWERLRSIVKRERIGSDYKVYPKRKSSGGKRWIYVPAVEVRAVQSWIAVNILNAPGAVAKLSQASQAYSKGSSIVRNAEQHAGAPWMVKMDIHNFFESVSERQVYWAFRGLGYPALLCFEMARICTRVAPPAAFPIRERDSRWRWNQYRERFRPLLPYDAVQSGHLPQGAPTSPMLSNLVAVQLDKQIREIASQFGGVYTRYADDLIISFSEGSRTTCQMALEAVRKVLGRHGFTVNRRKTHIVGPGARKIVTGLVVNDVRPRLRRQTRNHIEVALYYIETRGLIEHARFMRSKHPISYLNHLSGLIEFARIVEPVFGESALKRLHGIYAKNAELIQTLAEFSGKNDFAVRHGSDGSVHLR